MKLRFLIGFLLLSACAKTPLTNPRIDLQKDVYIQKNKCGKSNRFPHNVISMNFNIPKELIKEQEALIKIRELESGNQQIIQYKKDHYLYPALFNGMDHKEFNIPECKSSTCEVELYIFMSNWKGLKDRFRFVISAEALNGKNLFDHIFDPLKNDFKEFDQIIDPEFSVSYDDKKASIELKSSQLMEIKNAGFKQIELVFQWREGSQMGYQETNKFFALDDVNKGLIFEHEIMNPTYLGGLLMFKKGNLDFEKKIEILNVKNSFYECEKPRN